MPARRPCLVEGVDVRTLPLGPEDAYVLSRIDGVATEAEIVAVTGLSDDRVRQTLERLERLGAIRSEEVRSTTPSRKARPPTSSGTLPRVRIEDMSETAVSITAPPRYTARELDEQVDIDLARKRVILDTFHRLEESNLYDLLGVPRGADKKAVKAAYFELVNVFHPDRYYRKNLGSFKTKLEKVFSQLTVAHDTLTRAATREEYDAYLAAQTASSDLDRALTDTSAAEAEIARIEQQIEAVARAAERAGTGSSPSVPRAEAPARSATPASGPAPADPEARRRALARKLRTSVSPERRVSAAMPKMDSAERERAGDDFRRHYDERKQAALAAQLKRYLAQADEALRLDQPVGALNALRVAVKLSDDPKLAERLKTVEKQAYAALAKTFTDQGEYEYRNLRFPEAARSFEQALRGQNTAHLHLRAAQSLLDGNDNPRGAVEHAREAVALGPDAPAHHVVLGRAYYAAGLKTSAIVAFERAVTLDPSDASIQDWLRRAKRGEVIEPPVRSRSSRPPKDG